MKTEPKPQTGTPEIPGYCCPDWEIELWEETSEVLGRVTSIEAVGYGWVTTKDIFQVCREIIQKLEEFDFCLSEEGIFEIVEEVIA